VPCCSAGLRGDRFGHRARRPGAHPRALAEAAAGHA
jgi:hypothetical protein